MKEAGDIAAVSIPFATGIAAAFLIRLQYAPTGIVSATSLAAMLLAAVLAWNPKLAGRGAAAVLFLLAGMLSGTSSAMFPEESASRLLHSGLFEGIPFRHEYSAALLDALLTGDRSRLQRSITASFRASGASHILALSGLHLGIIYLAVSKILGLMGNGRTAAVARTILTVSVCLLYTAATGAGPSLVRALIFITINEILKLNPERGRSPSRLLLTTLLVQLVLKPSSITSLGFQLSYLAIAGILLISPKLEALWPGEWNSAAMRKIWSAASVSISCQLTTAPLVWITFHTFPEFFLISNLVSLPLTEALMICGGLTGMLSRLGISLPLLVRATDFLAGALVRSMEIIASM